ncbi:MAG: hypothetical protein CMD90_01515 [Gammaproteobacteria bacterium]|nr:hypothetical protein [Gammaproteobacteria bacterium]
MIFIRLLLSFISFIFKIFSYTFLAYIIIIVGVSGLIFYYFDDHVIFYIDKLQDFLIQSIPI